MCVRVAFMCAWPVHSCGCTGMCGQVGVHGAVLWAVGVCVCKVHAFVGAHLGLHMGVCLCPMGRHVSRRGCVQPPGWQWGVGRKLGLLGAHCIYAACLFGVVEGRGR